MTMEEAMKYAGERYPSEHILFITKIANAYIDGALYQQKKDKESAIQIIKNR